MVKLVLLRHGESVWNKENKFTGWSDVKLSNKGVQEAHDAGKLLKKFNFQFDLVFTSFLKRAIDTTNIVLDELNQSPLIIKSWRLNERHYGSLQGLNKAKTAKVEGEDKVQEWRRSFEGRPPALEYTDKRHPKNDALYVQVDDKLLPSTESLKDCMERVIPFFDEMIVPALEEGKIALVSAHGNSLRALRKHLEHIADQDIPKLEIPTGKPFVIEFDDTLSIVNTFYLE